MAEEDEDVLWEGSPLHMHLQNLGLDEDATHIEGRSMSNHATAKDSPVEDGAAAKVLSTTEENTNVMETAKGEEDETALKESQLLMSAKSFMWPSENELVLEVNVAKAILESELLVEEDEEFVSNFLLNEEIMAEYKKHFEETPSRGSSMLSDVILFSGSVAAVAGAVLYLSEKAKAATAAAAILPTAIAAMTSVRIGTKVSQDKESEHFHSLIELLLGDMKQFKHLVRRSLNLLQGMEMVSSGHYLSVDPTTGASSATNKATSFGANANGNGHGASGGSGESNYQTTKLAKALEGRTTFPALRTAAYKCTVQIISAYREAVEKLMEVSPLAEHVDFKEHYIAFVDLESFGIERLSLDDSDEKEEEAKQIATVQELKETAQVALVQQSEYLRRFSLTFCDRVREDNELNKAGVLKHIRDLIGTIRKINNKLSKVLEYHQAMGMDIERMMSKPKSLQLHSSQRRSQRAQRHFVPLRSVYTSMFSTGLHLQNSLLKVRELEKVKYDSFSQFFRIFQ